MAAPSAKAQRLRRGLAGRQVFLAQCQAGAEAAWLAGRWAEVSSAREEKSGLAHSKEDLGVSVNLTHGRKRSQATKGKGGGAGEREDTTQAEGGGTAGMQEGGSHSREP